MLKTGFSREVSRFSVLPVPPPTGVPQALLRCAPILLVASPRIVTTTLSIVKSLATERSLRVIQPFHTYGNMRTDRG